MLSAETEEAVEVNVEVNAEVEVEVEKARTEAGGRTLLRPWKQSSSVRL